MYDILDIRVLSKFVTSNMYIKSALRFAKQDSYTNFLKFYTSSDLA